MRSASRKHTTSVSRRKFMVDTATVCGASALLAGGMLDTETVNAVSKPNLVFVFSDQQSWDMLGCYGNIDLHTPQFDRFATQSVRFNHCISYSPVCTPYRSILLSGLHPLYNGAIENDAQMLPGNGLYLGELLRDAGYHLGYYGKWHLYGGDRVRPVPPGDYRYGFDNEFLTNNCTLVFDAERAYYWDHHGDRKLYGDWEPYAQTRQAIDFLEENHDKPFALFLSWHPPHDWNSPTHYRYGAPEDCLALYDPDELTLRPTVEDTYENRSRLQGHMAMISSLDRAFGELLNKIDALSLTDNTIVVYTSDHGDTVMAYHWPHNKGRPEHLSCRVPLLLRWPNRIEPGVNGSLIGTFDLMPTLLGLLGLNVPESCQGQDCSKAIINGEDAGINEQHLFFLPLNWRGIYTRRYTYAYSVNPEQGLGEGELWPSFDVLYDREVDPWETRNLFHEEAYQGIREELHEKTQLMMVLFKDTGMPFDKIRRYVAREEDFPNVVTSPADRPQGWEYRLKGRPVDYLPGFET